MKKVKHESKAIKETPEEAARRAKRERARRRRERIALASPTVDATERSVVGIKVKKIKYAARDEGLSGRSDPASDERESDVPVRKEKGVKRMKTVITQDNILQMLVSPNPEDGKIQFCDDHYDELVKRLQIHGIDHLITDNLESLKARLAANKVDPLWHSQDALIRLSLNAIGSEGVIQYRCPVCAFKKFDFIAQVALAIKQAIVRKPS